MKHTQYVYTVVVQRDPVPGWNNQPEDVERLLQRYLDDAIPHYNPTVVYVGARERNDG